MNMLISNAKIVTPDHVISGSVYIHDGMIKEIDTSCALQSRCSSFDCNGDYLIPGLVELHTDNLEKHLVPRPGVRWPSPLASVLAHDIQVCGSGITTVCDAISVGEYRDGGTRRKLLDNSIQAINFGKEHALFRADHYIHLRCEISDAAMMEMFEKHSGNSLVKLVSLMDHTPGQRQWINLDKYRLFHKSKNWTDEEFHRIIEELQRTQQTYAAKNRMNVLQCCRMKRISIASHDDTTEQHVEDAAAEGITISEFPTTLAAAQKACEKNLAVIAGAPNIVCGQSHSGNVSAATLAMHHVLDGMSSDYVPSSLLHSAFMLHTHHGISLPDAIAKVSKNIAQLIHCNDRGQIAEGKRADLVQVKIVDSIPLVRSVWVKGRCVLH